MSTEDGESTIIKVFLDTNRIASTSFDSLFGMKPLLQKLTKVTEIILPKIVFEEMIEQKLDITVQSTKSFQKINC